MRQFGIGVIGIFAVIIGACNDVSRQLETEAVPDAGARAKISAASQNDASWTARDLDVCSVIDPDPCDAANGSDPASLAQVDATAQVGF